MLQSKQSKSTLSWLGLFTLCLIVINVITYKPKIAEPNFSVIRHTITVGLPFLNAQNIQNRFFSAYATETITIDNTSGGVGFSSSKINLTNTQLSANLVSFKVECASGTSCPMRFTLDGTTVSTTVGFLVDYGDIVNVYNYVNITRFKAIRTGATSASIQPIYWN